MSANVPSMVHNHCAQQAGVYVPTLAKEILDNAPEINLHGVAVGDPCTDNKYQADSMDMVWYGHKYGFLQDDQFEFLWNNCSARAPAPLSKGRWGAADVDAVAKRSTYLSTLTAPEPLSESCKLAMRQFEASSSRGFSQGWNNAWINDVSLYGPSVRLKIDVNGMVQVLPPSQCILRALNWLPFVLLLFLYRLSSCPLCVVLRDSTRSTLLVLRAR